MPCVLPLGSLFALNHLKIKNYYTCIKKNYTKFRYKQSIQDLDKPEEDEGVSVPILLSVGEVC